MKRLFLVIVLVALLFGGCAAPRTDITSDEVIAAYEAAGYNVCSGTYEEEMEYGMISYVQADHPDGDYIYFTWFETVEDAKAYEKDLDHPVMMGLFSVIYGDPSWVRLEVYGCVAVTYDDPALFGPFEELLKSK